ncbi:meiotic recombination protein SPO11 [Lampris incognitus]|uniref:meiotic recombination protein SPO11 n=1 Tax=Lampris incognitus TaxID=2546036 RepID=UPI0024B583B0|nr:meiotic recombination protein SPO11 [Lampris incognitus]
MESDSEEMFGEIDKLRDELSDRLTDSPTTHQQDEEGIGDQEVLDRIEKVILDIIASLSKYEAPVLELTNRSSWTNVSFESAVGLQMNSGGGSVTAIRSDCPTSVTKFAHVTKILAIMYKLVQSDSYATKRDIYYNNTQLFGSQKNVDCTVDDISCMLKVPRRRLHVLATSKGFISGDLCYLEEDGTKVDCHSSSAAVPVSSNVIGIKHIVSPAKFVIVVEKDATFQRLLDDDFCTKLSPCIIITGKGVPDVNSRLMVRKLWDTLHIPIFALMDSDPSGIEIMSIYKYGSVAMSFEAHSLTVPSVMWLGLLPSDIQRLRVPQNVLIPLTRRDENKLRSLLERPYLAHQPAWHKEMTLMQQNKVKAELQSLSAIAPNYLTRVYLPNKLRYGGWI